MGEPRPSHPAAHAAYNIFLQTYNAAILAQFVRLGVGAARGNDRRPEARGAHRASGTQTSPTRTRMPQTRQTREWQSQVRAESGRWVDSGKVSARPSIRDTDAETFALHSRRSGIPASGLHSRSTRYEARHRRTVGWPSGFIDHEHREAGQPLIPRSLRRKLSPRSSGTEPPHP